MAKYQPSLNKRKSTYYDLLDRHSEDNYNVVTVDDELVDAMSAISTSRDYDDLSPQKMMEAIEEDISEIILPILDDWATAIYKRHLTHQKLAAYTYAYPEVLNAKGN